MKVKELIAELSKYPEYMEVLTKKTEFFGNVAYVNTVKHDSYSSFGHNIPCVMLTDEFEEEEE